MTPSQSAMIAAVRPHVNAGTIVTDPVAIAPWLDDWRGRFHGASPALLAPDSVDAVQRIVAGAAQHGVALVPQGGNTSMVGGATPPPDGRALILSLRRLDRVRSIDPLAGTLIAEAGVILDHVHAAALDAGRRFPLTLGARGSATVGGLVSTNAGGTQVVRFGSMRRLVLGVEAVLADGSLHDGLAGLAKDNRGYDIDQLLIGAEGTLGIVTAAALRLVPVAGTHAIAWAAVEDPEAALRVLRDFQAIGDAVESFEVLPAESLAAVLAHVPGSRAPLPVSHPWHALIELSGADSPAILERVLASAIEDGGVHDAVIAASEAQAADWWRIREAISPAERALGPAAQHDISVPVDRMPRFMVEAAAACDARFPGTHASGFGHLGDGNIHFHVRAAPGTDPARWYGEDVPVVTQFVHDLVTAAGGSIAAEHGIGQMKRAELERLGPPARLGVLRAIKAALDPQGILNPGKLVTPPVTVAPPPGAP